MKRIYISGKISGLKPEVAQENFARIEQMIGINKNNLIINPMKLPHKHKKSYEDYMKECIYALLECDTIFMMKNHKESQGAMLELCIARTIGLTVLFEDDSNAA